MQYKDRLNINVDRELVEHLQNGWGGLSLTRVVDRSLRLLCKYDPRLLEAREYDLLNCLQMPEALKLKLIAATGCRTWQGAVMDIVVEYLDNQEKYNASR